MPTPERLTPEQLSDLAQLHTIAEQFATDMTIIGATALQCFIDLPRFTNDIDLVVALDLESFGEFKEALRVQGWNQQERHEHRWHGPSGSIIDIVPAGPGLRAAQQVVWPGSEFAMSLVGFEHVFTRAVEVEIAADARYRVATPAVIGLLKIVAYMDNQQRRHKDLHDLRILFREYEATTGRIFSEEVFAAELEDFEEAGALLLGADIGAFATDEEALIVQSFLDGLRIPAEELAELDRGDFQQTDTRRFQQQLRAFSQGFLQSRNR